MNFQVTFAGIFPNICGRISLQIRCLVTIKRPYPGAGCPSGVSLSRLSPASVRCKVAAHHLEIEATSAKTSCVYIMLIIMASFITFPGRHIYFPITENVRSYIARYPILGTAQSDLYLTLR